MTSLTAVKCWAGMKVRFSTVATRGFLFLPTRCFDQRFAPQISKWKKIILKESLWDQGTRYETIFLFLEQKLSHRHRHTHVHAARIFADVAQEKWRPKFPKELMLLAHNSTRLCLLEFCWSIFVVSCSSLSEDSVEFRSVPLNITDQVVFRCFFYKNFTLLHSKFHICKRLKAFP